MQKLAGFIFIVAAAVAGVVASMTTLIIPDVWTYVLFGLCGLAALVGLVLTFWPVRDKAQTPKPGEVTIASHDQVGGITAHTVNVGSEDVR